MWWWWIFGALMLILFVRKASPTIPLEHCPHLPPIHADVFRLVRWSTPTRYHMILGHKPEKERKREKKKRKEGRESEKRKSEEKVRRERMKRK
ncbi:hypothetical protein Bpfe_012747 [Biomphalaria pfeifferi]|uniref:Secreted protein n=1 Tax=Biomphalaria pfeifferi TaxID=112525 RepID=A0AAD8BNC5_BIOPF|nr:hypothetical protein Bpfe_012747 [Biomphalaria pfeifferi]